MSGPIQSAKTLIGRRPAETATATAGAVGLLLSAALDADDELRVGLVVLLAALPAVISYVHDLGKSQRLPHDLSREVEELALRSVRRARMGHDIWADDLAKAKQFAELRTVLDPPPASTNATDDGARSGAPGKGSAR